ncbi:MAG: adenosylcobinamide-phosphate synthase CbiB [Anaerolineae bacterium]|nr:adenosylcobinamide-phosphate synthase CbiB [Anaerolineae bacterium]
MYNPERGLIGALALVIDALLGDPPNRFHPVAWMGSFIHSLAQRTPRRGKGLPLLSGGFILLSGGLLSVGFGLWLQRLCRRLPAPISYLCEALLFSTTIAGRGLASAGHEIEAALSQQNLPEARRLLSWHLVSRDTGALSAAQVSAATIESIAENSSDGLIAPLFYYQLAGLPGAFLYRFANTADAMLGYHDARHEWLGKLPARLDDLLNLIPARLTAGLIVLSAALRGLNWRRALFIWRRDASRTASPNAGQPMSAAAGALGVELEKVGYYRLGEGQPPPRSRDISLSVRLLQGVTLLAGFSCILIGLFSGLRRRRS